MLVFKLYVEYIHFLQLSLYYNLNQINNIQGPIV